MDNLRRYTVTFTDRAGAKARYRQALKLMGADDVRILEAEVEATETKPKKKDNTPTSPEARAVADLFGREYSRPWSDAEIDLFRKAAKTKTFTLENMKLITTYYAAERKKNHEGVHRRDLSTFLRNASGELDRARAFKPRNGHALEWADSRPKLEVLPDPVEVERLAAQAREGLAAFRRAKA